MREDSTPLHELEKLSNFLHGAHLASDHENSSATFHQAKHMLDEIIIQIKLNSKPWVALNPEIIGGYAHPKA